jgi:hypothetical protein
VAGGPAHSGRPGRGRAGRWRLGRGPVPAPGDLFRPGSGRPRYAAARRGALVAVVAAAAAAATPATLDRFPGRSHDPYERGDPPGPRRPPCRHAAPALLPGEHWTLLGSFPPRGPWGRGWGRPGAPATGGGARLLVCSLPSSCAPGAPGTWDGYPGRGEGSVGPNSRSYSRVRSSPSQSRCRPGSGPPGDPFCPPLHLGAPLPAPDRSPPRGALLSSPLPSSPGLPSHLLKLLSFLCRTSPLSLCTCHPPPTSFEFP